MRTLARYRLFRTFAAAGAIALAVSASAEPLQDAQQTVNAAAPGQRAALEMLDPHVQTLDSEPYDSQANASAAMQTAEKVLGGFVVVDGSVFQSGSYYYSIKFVAAPNLQVVNNPVPYQSMAQAAYGMANAEKKLIAAGYAVVEDRAYQSGSYYYVVKFIAAPQN